jgi:hypothetical protein
VVIHRHLVAAALDGVVEEDPLFVVDTVVAVAEADEQDIFLGVEVVVGVDIEAEVVHQGTIRITDKLLGRCG